MIYGHDKTIHQTKEVNVEVDKDGQVVSVWFRCMALPFTVTIVDDDRTDEMVRMYQTAPVRKIEAIHFEDL